MKVKIEWDSSGVIITCEDAGAKAPTMEQAISDLMEIFYQRGKIAARKMMEEKKKKTTVEVLSCSATHFQMPSAIILVKQKYQNGEEDRETTVVRLGQPVDVDQLIAKKSKHESE